MAWIILISYYFFISSLIILFLRDKLHYSSYGELAVMLVFALPVLLFTGVDVIFTNIVESMTWFRIKVNILKAYDSLTEYDLDAINSRYFETRHKKEKKMIRLILKRHGREPDGKLFDKHKNK